jgi:hypothetical protein
MLHDPSQFLAFVWSGWTATWPTQLLALIWVAWLVSWAVGSFFSGRTEKHVRTWDSRAYHIPILAGAVLLTPWTAQVLGERPLWHVCNSGTYLLAGLTLAGSLFTWWARIHLGRFWSNAAFGLWQKARMEEGFLTVELGADAYGPYCRRVPILVPFLPQR